MNEDQISELDICPLSEESLVFLEQLKCERLVALRESAVADHVREHNRGEFAMFGAALRHIANWTPKGIQVRAYQKGVCKAKESEATHNWNSSKLCKNSSNLMQR